MTERLDGRRLELPCERAGEAPTTFEWREQREKGGGGERDAGVVRVRPPGSAAPGVIITRRPKPLSLSLFLGVGEGVSQVLIGLTDPQTDQPRTSFLKNLQWAVKLATVHSAQDRLFRGIYVLHDWGSKFPVSVTQKG